MSQAGWLSQLIYPLQAGRIVIPADLSSPGYNPLQAAARTPALGQLHLGRQAQVNNPHVAQQHPGKGNLPGYLSLPHLLPSREPFDHPCKASCLSSWVAEVGIARGSQSARATSVCQKYNLFYCPNEGNESITSTKTQISVNKALACSHNCQTSGISLPMNECSLPSRNCRQPRRDLSGRLSCGTGDHPASCTDTFYHLISPALVGEGGLPSES